MAQIPLVRKHERRIAQNSQVPIMPLVINTGDDLSPPPIVEPDAHGQAALVLTESLIHLMVDKAALTNAEAIEVIQVAQEVKAEVATNDGESAHRIQETLALLRKMSASFKADI